MGLRMGYSDDRLGGFDRPGETFDRSSHRLSTAVRAALAIALLVLGVLYAASAADAQAGSHPANPRVVVVAPIENRTDQRLDRLDKKVDDASAKTAEDIRKLRVDLKASFKGAEDKVSDKLGDAVAILFLSIAVMVIPFATYKILAL